MTIEMQPNFTDSLVQYHCQGILDKLRSRGYDVNDITAIAQNPEQPQTYRGVWDNIAGNALTPVLFFLRIGNLSEEQALKIIDFFNSVSEKIKVRLVKENDKWMIHDNFDEVYPADSVIHPIT